MRIEILGTRGNIKPSSPKYARHSGVLVDGRLLLDVGELEYLRRRPRHIFITHLHPDHAAILAQRVETDAQVYLPEPSRKLPGARVVSRALRVDGYRIVPVPTLHSVKVRSVGYRIEKGERAIFYSSDMVAIAPRYRRRLGRLDLVITEGSFMRRGGLVRIDRASGRPFGHAGIPELVELFRRHTRRIVITHFGSWFYRDIRAAVRQIEGLSNGVEVIAAWDGFTTKI